MELSEEMIKMIEVVKNYNSELKKSYTSYIASDIPDKVIKKLLKNFDSHMPVNSIIAYYDETVFNSTKRGTVFTTDGVYFKDIMTKPMYFRYIDIVSCEVTGNYLRLNLQNSDETYFDYYAFCDEITEKIVIEQLKKLDEEYGQTTFKSSGTYAYT